MKKLSIGFLLFSSVSVFCACNGGSSTSESISTSADSSGTTTVAGDTLKTASPVDTTTNNAGSQMVDQATRDFVAEAGTGGMAEVELGNLAQQKATKQEVKDFARMMVDDHTKANGDLMALANKKSIDVPHAVTDNQRKDINDLSKKSGADFDKAYVDLMVKDHKKTIDAFKKASGNLPDNDIKNFATTTLPTLQKHLEHIQSIKAKM